MSAPAFTVVHAPAGQAGPAVPQHRTGEVFRVLWHNPRSRVGLILFAVFLFFTVFGPWLTPYSPTDTNFAFMLAPSTKHLLGTTQSGADVLSQLIAGTRVSVLVSLAVGAVATFLAMLVGVTAGYVGGCSSTSASTPSPIRACGRRRDERAREGRGPERRLRRK